MLLGIPEGGVVGEAEVGEDAAHCVHEADGIVDGIRACIVGLALEVGHGLVFEVAAPGVAGACGEVHRAQRHGLRGAHPGL